LNFGEAWHRMSDVQKQDFMATVIRALHDTDKLTDSEADEAEQFFKIDGTDEMGQGVKKVFYALHSGAVRFNVDTDGIMISIADKMESFLMLLSLLPPMQQYEAMNEIIKELKENGEITANEADEAFADILKLFTYENYTHHSKGTIKVLEALSRIIGD
jgi:hypothetical protein